MSGAANFPTALDDDTSLLDVTDGVSSLLASHHNNLKEAVKALEKKVGIDHTTSPTALDYRLGSPTDGHRHDGASGQGPVLSPSNFQIPSGGHPSGGNLYDHLAHASLHMVTQMSGTGIASMVDPRIIFVPTTVPRYVHTVHHQGSLPAVGANALAPFSMPRTVVLEAIHGNIRRGPSGATTALDVNVGPTSIYVASQGLRPIFNPGATVYRNASPNYVTIPSGVIITTDVDAIGSNDPGQDLTLVFLFRE